MQHPHVVECEFATTKSPALVFTHAFPANDQAILLTEAAVAVVLMPHIVPASETFWCATEMEDQVTQANDL